MLSHLELCSVELRSLVVLSARLACFYPTPPAHGDNLLYVGLQTYNLKCTQILCFWLILEYISGVRWIVMTSFCDVPLAVEVPGL